MFVRVRDTKTRHQFDVPETDWRITAGHFELVKSSRFPPVDRPRQPKYYKPTRATKKEVKENG